MFPLGFLVAQYLIPASLIDFTFFFLALNKIIKINLTRKTLIQAFSETRMLLTGKHLNPFFLVCITETFPLQSNMRDFGEIHIFSEDMRVVEKGKRDSVLREQTGGMQRD